MVTQKPRLKIAPHQRGSELGTWAYKTVTTRFPDTATRIFKENELAEETELRLKALINDIPDAKIRSIEDPNAPDYEDWHSYVQPYLDLNWLQPPWFFTEHYFYRRILEATGFFGTGPGAGLDPFKYQKRRGLDVADLSIQELMAWMAQVALLNARNPDIMKRLVYLNLWGNQADLSLWPAEGDEKPDHLDLDSAMEHILVDDVEEVVARIQTGSPGRVDFLVDNAGFELVSDLAFADFLINSEAASEVHFHLKMHPTYVSDATVKDVQDTVMWLQTRLHGPTRSAGKRLQQALDLGSLQLQANWFWTSPLEGWKLSKILRDELSKSSLVISKGDANYRRLLGDRHWADTAAFDDILAYFPSPLLSLRTLKSELVVGLKAGQAGQLNQQDPEWMVNGRWGVVQFYPG